MKTSGRSASLASSFCCQTTMGQIELVCVCYRVSLSCHSLVSTVWGNSRTITWRINSSGCPMLDTGCSTCSSCTTHSAGTVFYHCRSKCVWRQCWYKETGPGLFPWSRATAKDCLESSYFKEKPLRECSPNRLSVLIRELINHVFLLFSRSLRTGADADVPAPSQQASRSPGRGQPETEQSLTNVRTERHLT